jgi:hypothetical protein
MKTDPISAALGYRMAIERIMKVQTLHEARQIAAKALDIHFDRPTESHISVGSGFGHATREPFVTIGIANPTESANPIVQVSTYDARIQAHYILEAADAAESDAFLVGWLGDQQGLTENQIGALLADFRAYRESRR